MYVYYLLAFVFIFYFQQTFHGILFDFTIDHSMMSSTKQDKIIKGMTLFIRLFGIKSRTIGRYALYVSYFSGNGSRVFNQWNFATGKCALIARHGK